ncbi:MAG: heavy metal translocating P-type ATPase [Planctomycetota bacterium]
MPRISLTIDGMHCASCVVRVEKALRTVEGVENASVNLTTNRAEIDGRGLVSDHLIKAVRQAGFNASLVGQPGSGSLSKKRWLFSRSAAFQRAIITLPFAIAVMYLAMAVHTAWSPLVQLIVASALMVVLGTPFFLNAVKGLRYRRIDMDTLIALGSGVAFIASVVAFITQVSGRTFEGHFGTAVAILWFITLGHALEHRARRAAASALDKLRQLAPEHATVIRNGQETQMPIDEVPVGATVLIKPGSRVPLDGTVKEGDSTLDQSMVTGESEPVEATVDTRVYAGTINQTGSLRVAVTATRGQTLLAQIVEMVEQAQGSKAAIQRIADKAAGVFVPIVILIAIATVLGWGLMQGDWPRGLNACIAVLIVACPCALGLAVPTAILVGTGLGASRGILIKDPAALERCYGLTHIILDKTGTLTTGQPAVTGIHCVAEDLDGYAMLRLAAAAERDSEHPMAEAIVRHAQQLDLDIPRASGFQSKTAAGVVASVEGQVIKVGRLSALREQGVVVPDGLETRRDKLLRGARTLIAVSVDNQAVGLIGLADEIRPEAAGVVAALNKLGLRTIMMTGDSQYAADHVARELSIDRTFAEVRPDDKRQKVLDLQVGNKSVVMVGDGINDAPALAEADLGIAIGSGTDIARDAGHAVLLGHDIKQLPVVIKLGRATMKRIIAGLLWASIYNICLIPMAATGLMPPMAAAIAMSLSSVSVVVNALWLKWTWRG